MTGLVVDELVDLVTREDAHTTPNTEPNGCNLEFHHPMLPAPAETFSKTPAIPSGSLDKRRGMSNA